MDFVQFLTAIDTFSDLDDDEKKIIAAQASLVDCENGSLLIRKGESGSHLWVIYDGKVEVVLTEDGQRRVLAELTRSTILGEMSLMTGEPAIADVAALGPCRAVKIPRGVFAQIIAKNQRTLQKFAKLVTARMVQRETEGVRRSPAITMLTASEDPYDLNFSSVREATKVLVLNCGSSSLKYSVFDTSSGAPLFEGLIERVGSPSSVHGMTTPRGRREDKEAIASMGDAFSAMVAAVTHPEWGTLRKLDEIGVVGHRVVHGGSRFAQSVVVDEEVSGAIRGCFPLAPLHNPYNLAGIEEMQRLLPAAPQVAVFDTAFHMGMQPNAYEYALPRDLVESERIRRYGFHGTNHRYVAMKAAIHLKRPLGEIKLISCHLGNGASVCAIDHGRSVDTSMGMTPLEGLVMGTRSGDIDPGIILHLMRAAGYGIDEIDRLLNKQSGLLGLSGRSNDMRELLAAAEAGDERCKNAVSVFCYRVKKYVGAYLAALGGADALIFTGGIGENSADVRAMVCQNMGHLGIVPWSEANQRRRSHRAEVIDAGEPGSRVRILVIPADEERMIAREALHAVGRNRAKERMGDRRSLPIPLSVSAHHVHLCQRDFEALFGEGRTPTPKAPLSQPGQFACAETVDLVGPKGRVDHVRILGPLRKDSQIEISRTEEYKLGIDAPVRESGDVEGTPGIVIEAEAGSIKLDKGVICAKRHIHMSPAEALQFGLRDKDLVLVRVKGPRELIFGDVLVRVSPSFKLDMHIDTDEANAAEITGGMSGTVEGIQSRAFM